MVDRPRPPAAGEVGLGLSSAVLLDATLIRGVLLPATMKLLGDWNWWLPGSLSSMPRMSSSVTGR